MVEASQETSQRQSSDLGRHAGSGASTALSFLTSLGAAAAGSCCAIPLALASVGVSGAWLGGFATLALYRPYILGVAVFGVGAGWISYIRKVRQRTCESGNMCGRTSASRWTFVALTTSTLLIVFAAASRWLDPMIVQALLQWNRVS